jgi:CheY-like chemotaxis protein
MKTLLPILIVDDQLPMREALSGALGAMGFREILHAVSGNAAMKVLRDTPVAAVISGWDMPGMTGIGLLRWVRSRPEGGNLPFMLVTAETNRERARMALAAGASEYLIKPYTVQDLSNKIQRILGVERRGTSLDARTAERVIGLDNTVDVEARIASSTVLVVDDVPGNIDVICAMLKGEYNTLAATSGQQALDIARSAQPPDLILLDVQMPGMNGYEVCRQLKSEPATRDIPVIFLTGNDKAQDVVRGLGIGAVDYIAKPAEPGILKARLRTHLRLKLALANLARQNATLATSAKLREDVARITQHDLKNPIGAIIAGADMLLADGGHSPSHAELIRLIQVEAWNALDQVNQSLSIYRMETGTFVLRPEKVDLADALATVRREILMAFAGLPLDIRFIAQDGGEVASGRYIAVGERGLCHSLFGNLVRNAVEASYDHPIIDVGFASYAGGVTVTIHNHGVVPAEIRECFFDKYVSSGKSDGTGLGTYSAKQVTEAQNGRIAMTTDETAGTTLTVWLPGG